MRSDAKPVARGQRLAGSEIGMAERVFGDDLAAVCDSQDAAGMLRGPQLEFDPVADIANRGPQPCLHACHLLKMPVLLQRPGCLKNSATMPWMLTGKTKPAQPQGLRRFDLLLPTQ